MAAGVGLGFFFGEQLSVSFDYQGHFFRDNAEFHLGSVKFDIPPPNRSTKSVLDPAHTLPFVRSWPQD